MKKIVNGKLYDTNEAMAICSWCHTEILYGIAVEVTFTLYREKIAENPLEGLKLGSWGSVSDYNVKSDTSKGEFFLAIQVDGLCGNKGRVQPLDIHEARRTFEKHTNSDFDVEDKYKEYFGVHPQKSVLKQIKEAFKAGAEAKQKQYEEEKAKKDPEMPF